MGAQIRVQLGERTLLREHRAGEGFAGQNSKTRIVGLGRQDYVDAIHIAWTSGRQQSLEHVQADTLLDIYEDPSALGNGEAARQSPYRIGQIRQLAQQPTTDRIPLQVNTQARLSIYVTVATWCQSCQSELNRVCELLQTLQPGTVAAYGIPIDPADTQQKLEQWPAKHQTCVPVLSELTAEQRQRVRVILRARATLPQAVPSTIITDQQGVVRAVYPGAFTLSQIRALLDS